MLQFDSASKVLNPKSTTYLIDLQLTRGTPLVFQDFAHNFFNMLRQLLHSGVVLHVSNQY
jgi:hypothetical protein